MAGLQLREEGGFSIKDFIKKNWLFLAILVFGIFLRAYKAIEWFSYAHDNDLIGWVIRDILENKHLRLIGQETSSSGIYIGPIYYYLLIPFYLIFKMDPIGSVFLSIIISGFSIFSFYWIFGKIFNKRVGLLSSLLYSISTLIVFTDREVVPTQPAMLWAIWFFYGLWLLTKGKQKAFILLGILVGLAWNINLALIVLAPLIFIAFFYSRKTLIIKPLILGLFALFISLSPFIVFEARHNFSQTKAVYASLTSTKDYVENTGKGFAKFDRVMQLVYRNTNRLVLGSDHNIPGNLIFLILLSLFAFLFAKKIIQKDISIIMFLWLVAFIAFFSFNSINISEYYLNGMNVVWIGLLALSLDKIISRRTLVGFFLVLIIIAANISSFIRRPVVTNGYVQRKELVSFIKEDAKHQGYPCISVSFTTSPGNDLGYRYFFWLSGLHVNHPESGSPVYTVAFPHTMVGRIDKSFGSLGLVLPGYERYTKRVVEESCRGEDSNLTDPLLKFTK